MAKIFFSYSRKDEGRVRDMASILKKQGHSVFFAGDSIPAGQKFQETISRELKNCDVVVSVISSNSIDSKWVMTEVGIALGSWQLSGRPLIIPLILDDVEIPHQLLSIQSLIVKNQNIEEAMVEVSASIGVWEYETQIKEKHKNLSEYARRRRIVLLFAASFIAVTGMIVSIYPYFKVEFLKTVVTLGSTLAATGIVLFSKLFLEKKEKSIEIEGFLEPSITQIKGNFPLFQDGTAFPKVDKKEEFESEAKDPIRSLALSSINSQQRSTLKSPYHNEGSLVF